MGDFGAIRSKLGEESEKVFESFAGVGGVAAADKQSLTWIQDGF